MISGISETVSVSSIIDSDQLIIEGTIFGFNGGYEPVEIIEPGNGYWLRSSGNGEIIIESAP